MNASDTADLERVLTRLFTEKATHERVIAAETIELDDALWADVAALGLPWVGLPEEAGGSGGGLDAVVTVLRAAGTHAVPLPLMETHLAAWTWARAGGRVETGRPWSIAPGAPGDALTVGDGRVTGTLHDVAWGGAAARVVALAGDVVVLLDPADADVLAGRDLAGQPRDVLRLDGVRADVRPAAVTADELLLRGATLRAAQMGGAMQAVYDLTHGYTYQRQQFGRPVGTFQAVRRHLVQLAQAAVLTSLAADRAAAALESGRDASLDALAAKLVADTCAALSVRSGHQAHGAIGMTREYALQNLTRRLNAWRGDWGTELALAARIGDATSRFGHVARAVTDAGAVSA